jgi:hypothetical protein
MTLRLTLVLRDPELFFQKLNSTNTDAFNGYSNGDSDGVVETRVSADGQILKVQRIEVSYSIK